MAQKTAAQILTEITTLLADNSTGAISAEDVRSVLTDIKDSFVNLSDAGITTAEAAFLNGVTSAIQTQIDGKLANVVEDTTPQLGGDLDADENNITNVTTFQFAGGTGTQGQMSWNSDEETVDLVTNGESINIGQELEYHVRNNSGSTIAKGTPVMSTGTIGASGRITISPLASTTVTNAKYFLGIANESIANNEDGKVLSFGKIRQIDTSGASFTQVEQTWNDGDIIWIDAANDGKLTNVEPTSGMKLPIAFVIDAEENGTLFVRATQGSSINETNDIDFEDLSEGDLLQYNGTNWVNVSGATGTFESADGKTITVTSGIITNIVV